MLVLIQPIPESWAIPGWVLYLTAVAFLFVILARGLTIAGNYWRGGTTLVIEDMQADGLLPTKDKWETLMSDVSDVKKQQTEFGKKLDNGISERLDGLEQRHETLDGKIDGLVVGLSQLQGMMQARERDTGDGD